MMKCKSRKISLIMVGALIVSLFSGCGAKEEAGDGSWNGFSYSKEDTGITVSLETDKESYKAGEELHYRLTVANDRTDYTVSMIQITAGNADEFTEIGTPKFSGSIKTGESSCYEGTLVAFTDEETESEPIRNTAVSGDVESVTIRPYVTVNYGGEELIVRYIVTVVMYQNRVVIEASDKKTVSTVSVHDPSIVVGEDKEGKKCYYIFGSHLAFAKSYDLENWTMFTNNLNSDYKSVFAEPAAWSAHGSNNYNVQGFMWAPDVIYNEAMGKWCMYMSIDGDYWYSSIVLLTADTLEGDWTYEGIVVYSGFHAGTYQETDVARVTGEEQMNPRYDVGKKWGDYYPNNIDACVFYAEDGRLLMSYGSWSGGIFILELDENTGLRDYSVSYEDNKHSDPYFGTKIAGGAYVSGEGSYIQHIGDYYYLFMSYGNLEAKGGYNVRVFRSDRPDGGYVDELGNTPYFDTYVFNYNMPVGVRLFGGYKWRTMGVGQVAQGHNSAFVDDDGRAYMIFHTRTTNGSEGHYVKVHQLFLNKNGWLVAAPYATAGESLDASVNTVDNICGTYDFMIHHLDIDYKNYETSKVESIELNADGTISGDYTGTWSLEEGTSYISLSIDGVTYDGVTLEMDVEGTTIKTMVFTALGDTNQITVWGSKVIE